ncbi:MAG: membrane protein insertase YidC [Verrucomicrobia bacterium]|nr:membrane protein insertase YidC [Verrucomicrobiota bacterium]
MLSVIGLFAWQWYISKYYKPEPLPAGASAVPTATPSAAVAATPAATPVTTAEQPPSMSARAESLSTNSTEFVFNNDAGGIEQVILRMHLGENHDNVALNRSRSMPIGAFGFNPGEVLGGFEMTADRAKGEVFFKRTQPDGLEISKRFTLPPGDGTKSPYTVNLEVTFTNPGSAAIQVPDFFISAGGAAPIHIHDLPMYTRFDWGHEAKMSNIDVNWFSASSVPLIGIPIHGERPLYLESNPDIRWAAVASQYFCTIVTPQAGSATKSVWAKRFDAPKLNGSPVFGVQGGLIQGGLSLPPGARETRIFQIYSGPKEIPRLRELGPTQDQVMSFGMFGFVSEFLLWAMNHLHTILGNYAAAIIVLTLLIKTILWPVQNKATNEMRKMALLSPKMTEMRDKYKDNPQKLNEETMKLYKEYGVNPFSGCLPMFVQIPIFFGFYSMLGTAIELRNSSFLWVTDLSQPDTIAHILGFPINLLPIVMAGTMVWQMIITPKTGDAMQQRMFYFMPVIFLVFSYNYASGLALYWTTQNIFSIVQLYLTRNKPLPTLEKKSVVAKRTAAEAKKKSKNRHSP